MHRRVQNKRWHQVAGAKTEHAKQHAGVLSLKTWGRQATEGQALGQLRKPENILMLSALTTYNLHLKMSFN